MNYSNFKESKVIDLIASITETLNNPNVFFEQVNTSHFGLLQVGIKPSELF